MKKKITLLLTFFCLLLTLAQPQPAKAQEEADDSEVCMISAAVDVSGSMEKTDSNRDVGEVLKMMMDICDANDYFHVIAYNDQIVYDSGTISMSDSSNVESVKNKLDGLAYEGDTDNGLALKAATEAITESGIAYDRSMVILISDGDTDLPNSPLGRQKSDSDADMQDACALAGENGISINVIEYTDTYTNDTTQFSAVTSATGGDVTIVNEPMQLVQVALNLLFKCFDGKQISMSTESTDSLIGRKQIPLELQAYAGEYFLLYAPEDILDFEILDKELQADCIRTDRYVVLKITDTTAEELEILYSVTAACDVLTGLVKVEFPPEKEVIEVERESAKPIGSDMDKEVYTSKETLQIDVSELFADDDIIRYELTEENGESQAKLTGSLLFADVGQEGSYDICITATDAAGNQASAVIHITAIAAWKQYRKILTGLVIAGIVLVAAAICFLIIKIVLFRKPKEQHKSLQGRLCASFVDIKTKNSISDAAWNLSEYPPAGVSLQELFQSRNIREELKDIDKVCFYPSQFSNEIIMVHCIEGGVFLGDRHLKANVPVTVHDGDKIYISLAENASEIELNYTGVM
jgi:Mg-chelatase subunit ChlD